jgi:hypothetical protein
MKKLFYNSISKSYLKLINELDISESKKILIRTSWLEYLRYLDRMAKRDSICFHFFQLLVIVLGILIPIIEESDIKDCIKISSFTLISVFGLTIAISAALNKHFKFEEKWKHYRKTAEIIRAEGENYFGLAGEYKDFANSSEAVKKFIEIITDIKRQENNTYIDSVRGGKQDT